jgi:ABC-type Fe3+/spermidine/putrescine transport system ATPase subunit
MDVADAIAVLNEGRIEQIGTPRELYDHPTNGFVMTFLGPIARIGHTLVRPHDLHLTTEPRHGAHEAMINRVIHLGFEVRAELTRAHARRHRLGRTLARRCGGRARRAPSDRPRLTSQPPGSAAR